MLAKTLRVHLVVNSKMKKIKIKTYQVVAFTSVLISVMVLLLVLLTPLNPVSAVYDDDYAITGQLGSHTPIRTPSYSRTYSPSLVYIIISKFYMHTLISIWLQTFDPPNRSSYSQIRVCDTEHEIRLPTVRLWNAADGNQYPYSNPVEPQPIPALTLPLPLFYH